MEDLWLATHNQDKIKEFKILLKNWPFSLKTIGYGEPPEETGSSFLENARIKLNSLKKNHPSAWILAEDSGIEIDFLNGRPGIHSARYGGPDLSWEEKLGKLLHEMKPAQKRKAQMVSVIVLSQPNGKEIHAKGVIQGSIATSVRGSNGFAYDFVFIPQNEDKTLAELPENYKNQHSHRAGAVHNLAQKLKNILPH